MSATQRLLCVFTRRPTPGRAKSRLIPALGPEGAAALQRAMTERTLSRARGPAPGAPAWRTQVRIDDEGESAGGWPAGAECRPQGPGDLGARMRRAFAEGLRGTVAAQVLIGSDCPGLGAGDVADAFRALERRDVVFGPARDGGYWLVGLRQQAFAAAEAALFGDIGWGGAGVLAASLEAARRAKLRVALQRTLADVDRPEDLAHWEGALAGDRAGVPISVVIPALDEQERIGALVEQLRCSAGVEVIVADGGSRDATARLAAGAGARVVAAARGRASQMNAGAALACGEALLFLHADTRLPPGWEGAVRAALAAPEVVGGAFRFATDSARRSLRWIEAAADLRARGLGVIFGDQALFVRRDAFAALGGFPRQPLMEDYELVRRLRRRGALRLLRAPAVTSARRWEARGPLRNSLLNAALTCAYLAGVRPESLARWYRGRGSGSGGAGAELDSAADATVSYGPF